MPPAKAKRKLCLRHRREHLKEESVSKYGVGWVGGRRTQKRKRFCVYQPKGKIPRHSLCRRLCGDGHKQTCARNSSTPGHQEVSENQGLGALGREDQNRSHNAGL